MVRHAFEARGGGPAKLFSYGGSVALFGAVGEVEAGFFDGDIQPIECVDPRLEVELGFGFSGALQDRKLFKRCAVSMSTLLHSRVLHA